MTRAMGGDSALAANIIATTTLGSLVTTSLGAALMNYLGLMGWGAAMMHDPGLTGSAFTLTLPEAAALG